MVFCDGLVNIWCLLNLISLTRKQAITYRINIVSVSLATFTFFLDVNKHFSSSSLLMCRVCCFSLLKQGIFLIFGIFRKAGCKNTLIYIFIRRVSLQSKHFVIFFGFSTHVFVVLENMTFRSEFDNQAYKVAYSHKVSA